MANLFPRRANDWSVRQVPPKDDLDPRVPLAEEFALNGEIATAVIQSSRQDSGWVKTPTVTVTAPRTINLAGGIVQAPAISSYQANVAGSLDIPALSNASALVKQDDQVYLVAFNAEVGAAQDSTLGEVSFNYREEDTSGNIVIKNTQKENSKRIRSFWVWVVAPGNLSKEDFFNALPINSGGQSILLISNKTATGISLGNFRAYANGDDNLILNASYPIFPNLISVVPTCKIRRWQNYETQGYTWGRNGELPLSESMILISGKELNNAGISENIDKRIYEILSGTPGKASAWTRSVVNLASGSVASNLGNAGIPASSPNGSICLANDQRISYLNQGLISTFACTTVSASNDGNGNALLTFGLNTNVPSGTYFSSDRNDHKIYNLAGTDLTALGRFQNLGQSGSLIWVSESGGLSPGEQAIFQPGIVFPSGSGFSIPLEECTQAWVGNPQITAISSANLRYGHLTTGADQDLAEYEDPANNENFIVVFSKERAGILYIYKRISVVASGLGVISVPSTEKGVFAFVQGVTGRVNSPFVSGIAAGTIRKALIYYPPRSTETWQFLLSHCEYQRSNILSADDIDGAEIISRPRTFIHTQGGGNSAFFGETRMKFTPISMHLPDAGFTIPSHSLNTPVALSGESLATSLAFREIDYTPANAGSVVTTGKKVYFNATSGGFTRSLAGEIVDASGESFGCSLPVLSNGLAYQGIMTFGIRLTSGKHCLVIATKTSDGGVLLSSTASGSAIDIFDL